MAGPIIRSYRDLVVWQKGMDLVDACYALTRSFPSSERFALADQIRRAAVSIVANIAEGHGRSGTGSYLYHLSVARGSLRELETLLLISQQPAHADGDTYATLTRATDGIGRMLFSLSARVAASKAHGVPVILKPEP
ncbi:MAG TPA: four helix bundle protein [Gemmatimonadaceae bacterium]|nr:four helix bundle protein [Gemmatimonadaceae bacterium]